ncbi:MAG: bacteriohemerythrin [Bacteroidales bacterium]
MADFRDRLKWSDDLLFHEGSIDRDHQKIFELINEIIELEVLHPRSIEFAVILSKLSDYGLKHFKKEEALMQKYNYPRYKEHREIHMDYIYHISMFNLNFKSANHAEPEEVILYVKDWWYNHILGMDKELGNFIKQQKVL